MSGLLGGARADEKKEAEKKEAEKTAAAKK
jgi:hypothetical protein